MSSKCSLMMLFFAGCALFEPTDASDLAPTEMSEEEFIEAYLKGWCASQEECLPTYFYDVYESVDECYDLQEDLFDESGDGSGCEFHAEVASECIENLKRYTDSCDDDDDEDAQDSCYDAYECD